MTEALQKAGETIVVARGTNKQVPPFALTQAGQSR